MMGDLISDQTHQPIELFHGIRSIMILVRRKTNVFLVWFLFMGDGFCIMVNFISENIFNNSFPGHFYSKYTSVQKIITSLWAKMKNDRPLDGNFFLQSNII